LEADPRSGGQSDKIARLFAVPLVDASRAELDAWNEGLRSSLEKCFCHHDPGEWCPFCRGLSPQWMMRVPPGPVRFHAFGLLRPHRRWMALHDAAAGALEGDVGRSWFDRIGKRWNTPWSEGPLGSDPTAKALRAFVMDRDGPWCPWCSDVGNAVVDHIIPWRAGGAHHPDNLRVLCAACNSTKGGVRDLPLIEARRAERAVR
jgi:hypothetical protein